MQIIVGLLFDQVIVSICPVYIAMRPIGHRVGAWHTLVTCVARVSALVWRRDVVLISGSISDSVHSVVNIKFKYLFVW